MTSAPGVQYVYDGQNKRNYAITKDSGGSVIKEEFYFSGADGKKLGTYYLQQISVGSQNNQTLTFTYVNPVNGQTGPGTITYFRGQKLGGDRWGRSATIIRMGRTKARQIRRTTM